MWTKTLLSHGTMGGKVEIVKCGIVGNYEHIHGKMYTFLSMFSPASCDDPPLSPMRLTYCVPHHNQTLLSTLSHDPVPSAFSPAATTSAPHSCIAPP